MKYPSVIFFRYDKYSSIDNYLKDQKENLLCEIHIVNSGEELNQLFNCNNQILVTYGESEEEYYVDVNSIIANRMRKQWIHKNEITDINNFNSSVNHCYIHNVINEMEPLRPDFSLFTTCYNSYDKIVRAYNSIKLQTLKDWEWVILDDSPDDNHFVFLKELFKDDNRIRLYKRSQNSGNIGNVKNEAVSLCRGRYVIEMDHDDEILPYVLMDSKLVFEKDESIGFIYMDFVNIYESKNNFRYCDYFALGYSGYYRQKYNDNWVYVASTPNINNVTLSHIVSVPNHPRIWRRSVLLNIGNYSEFLPVSDDYELLIRTAALTNMAKIHKLGYVQYMNDNNNNFSLIRNSEINRLIVPIKKISYEKYNIVNLMKTKDAYEDEKYCHNGGQIWKRNDFTHKYCNKIINLNYVKQYCIIGLDTLYHNLNEIYELYQNNNYDFILLDNIYNSDSNELCIELDNLGLSKIKCYSLDDCTEDQLINYFMLIYKSCDDYHIFNRIEENNINSELELESNTKKITIITPSIRPENLLKIKESINFDFIDEWIIVYDGTKILTNPKLFSDDKITEYVYTGIGNSGNSQRNYALDNVKNKNTYIYFLDDDNCIHPELYDELIKNIQSNKIYTFDQIRPADVYPFKELLKGNNIRINNIDTAMFLIDYNLCKDTRWIVNRYNSDGIFIVQCYLKNKKNWIYINKVLSYYNSV